MTHTVRATRALCLPLLLALATMLAACGQRDDAASSVAEPSTPALRATPPAPATAPSTAPAPAPSSSRDDVPHIVKQMPAADVPTPPMAMGAAMKYSCDDGFLLVTYHGARVDLTLPDGTHRSATLSVEASAKEGGEVFLGPDVGLHRISNVIEVQTRQAAPRRCLEVEGNA